MGFEYFVTAKNTKIEAHAKNTAPASIWLTRNIGAVWNTVRSSTNISAKKTERAAVTLAIIICALLKFLLFAASITVALIALCGSLSAIVGKNRQKTAYIK